MNFWDSPNRLHKDSGPFPFPDWSLLCSTSQVENRAQSRLGYGPITLPLVSAQAKVTMADVLICRRIPPTGRSLPAGKHAVERDHQQQAPADEYTDCAKKRQLG
jgi:hypothetical protein